MPRGPKPLPSPLKANEFYCLHCRKRCTADAVKKVSVRNSKRGTIHMKKGHCKSCEGKVCRIVKN